jgi:hypothetical protein
VESGELPRNTAHGISAALLTDEAIDQRIDLALTAIAVPGGRQARPARTPARPAAPRRKARTPKRG